MKKRVGKAGIVVFLMIFVSLFIVGCGIVKVGGSKDSTQVVSGRFVGSQGLVMSFIQNAPPARIYSSENLPVLIHVENKGTYDFKEDSGTVYLTGFDPSIISFDDTDNKIPELYGRSQHRVSGAVDLIEFLGEIKGNGLKVERYNAIIMATACYKYETKVEAELCVDPDPFAITRQQKICTPSNILFSGGQGAPIAVTAVEVDPSKGKTRLRIHIKNIGGGTVFDKTKISNCSPSNALSFSDVDKIFVEEISAAGKTTSSGITCTQLERSNKFFKLIYGEGVLYCDIDDLSGSAFITPLQIKLSYGYRDFITRQIEVRKIPN